MRLPFLSGLLIAWIAGPLASAAWADPFQGVAKELAAGLDVRHPTRIAVLSFPYHNGDVSDGSSIVAERLTTAMVGQRGTQVVERALIHKTMEEIRFGMTGALDSATTQKLGRLLGADAIVTGTLIDFEEDVTEVNARLIQTETGAILAAANTHVRRTWSDLPRPPRHESASPEASSLHMSPLIANNPSRMALVPPTYHGPMQPIDPDSPPDSTVLTLTRADLVPLRYGNDVEPEGIVNRILSESKPPRPEAVRVARRIYNRHPDPRLRGRALMAMGHLMERSLRPEAAADVYRQVLREFTDTPALQQEARQGLARVSPSP